MRGRGRPDNLWLLKVNCDKVATVAASAAVVAALGVAYALVPMSVTQVLLCAALTFTAAYVCVYALLLMGRRVTEKELKEAARRSAAGQISRGGVAPDSGANTGAQEVEK